MNINIEALRIEAFEDENIFQAKAIYLISQEFPKLRDKVWHTQNEQYIPRLPNESDKAYKERCLKIGNLNKARGKLAGVMDILIVFNGILYKIELKVKGRKTNEAQIDIHHAWNKDCQLIQVQVCYTLYHVYTYCKWIVSNNLKINFPEGFKQFELI